MITASYNAYCAITKEGDNDIWTVRPRGVVPLLPSCSQIDVGATVNALLGDTFSRENNTHGSRFHDRDPQFASRILGAMTQSCYIGTRDIRSRVIRGLYCTSNLYWWGKGWPVDGLPFPDTGCPVPDVSIYYMSNINELPDGILFHWFCKCTPPWMFLPLDIPSEYRPEHVTFGLLCVIFKFPSRIFCRRVPGFATDCPCGVWCRGLTTCLLYVGPPLEF